MRSVIAVILSFGLALTGRADDVADVKQAYITYLQARLDHNLEVATATSVGDELAHRYLAVDIERQVLADQLEAMHAKIAKAQPRPPRPKMVAAETFKFMLETASVTVDAETATIVPKGTPPEAGYGFRKVDGVWKADLNRWNRAIREENVKAIEAGLPLMRDLLAKAERGDYKTQKEFEDALKAAE